MAFRQALNRVKIEGILSETDIQYKSFTNKQTGAPSEAIGGVIKVLINQEVNGQPVDMEVPVHLFSVKYKKDGTLNPAFTSIETVMKEFISIASCGSAAGATKVRLTGNIVMNEFPGTRGMISQPRIQGSFVSKAIGEFKPEASFTLEFMVSSINRATDSEGVELDPPKLNVNVVVPQYTAPTSPTMNVDLVTLTVTNPNVMNAVETYWEPGYCYSAGGRLNFSSRTEKIVEECDFGEPQESIRTINVHEFIITRGSQSPLEGDMAFEIEDVKAGMAARKQRLEDLRTGKVTAGKKTPEANKSKPDLGF